MTDWDWKESVRHVWYGDNLKELLFLKKILDIKVELLLELEQFYKAQEVEKNEQIQ